MAVFQARQERTCSRCRSTIHAGTLVTWSKRKRGCFYHADCAHPERSTRRPQAQRTSRHDRIVRLSYAELGALVLALVGGKKRSAKRVLQSVREQASKNRRLVEIPSPS